MHCAGKYRDWPPSRPRGWPDDTPTQRRPGERHTTENRRQPTRLTPRKLRRSDRTLPVEATEPSLAPTPPLSTPHHHLRGVERVEHVRLGARAQSPQRTQSPQGQHEERLLHCTTPRTATPGSSAGMARVKAAAAAAAPPSSQRSSAMNKKQGDNSAPRDVSARVGAGNERACAAAPRPRRPRGAAPSPRGQHQHARGDPTGASVSTAGATRRKPPRNASGLADGTSGTRCGIEGVVARAGSRGQRATPPPSTSATRVRGAAATGHPRRPDGRCGGAHTAGRGLATAGGRCRRAPHRRTGRCAAGARATRWPRGARDAGLGATGAARPWRRPRRRRAARAGGGPPRHGPRATATPALPLATSEQAGGKAGAELG